MIMPNWTGRGRGPGAGARRARAFSLVEMLVVIGIIGILISLALVAGTQVIASGKARATADVIRVLDESRDAWTRNWQKPLPEFLVVDETPTKQQYFPLIDARLASSEDWTAAATPSLTYYTALMMKDPSISPIFEQIDSAFLKPTSVPGPNSGGKSEEWALRALEITDAWGRPIRFVHPAFHGGYGPFWDAESKTVSSQRDTLTIKLPTNKGIGISIDYRRSYRPFRDDDSARRDAWVGDGDEGMCVGNAAYFYATGEDGDPGTREDNVYTTEPRFPVETRDFK